MPEPAKSPTAPSRPGFFREGWRELGRKLERRKLRGQFAQQDRQRSDALARLGQHAWEEKLDLSAHPEVRDQLRQLDGRAGELTAATQSLEAERAALEEKRRAAVAEFDARRRGVEEKKRPVDDALRAARQRQADQEGTVQRLDRRLAVLPKEVAALDQQIATLTASAAPDRDAQRAAAESKRQQLQAEQAKFSSELPAAKAALSGLVSEVNRLHQESQGYAGALNTLEAERKTALAALDAELNRVRTQLSGTTREAGAVGKERTQRFAALGLALYGSQAAAAEPALADALREIAGLDQTRAATQAALDASLAQTRALPPGTMAKFTAAMILIPGVMFAMGAGVYYGSQALLPGNGEERREGTVIVPLPPTEGKKQCEPLKTACQRAQNWKDCAQDNLQKLLADAAAGRADVAVAMQTFPHQGMEWLVPLLVRFDAALLQLERQIPTWIVEVNMTLVTTQADCALLPGPEDEGECREAAQRVEERIKEAQEKLERDLDLQMTLVEQSAMGLPDYPGFTGLSRLRATVAMLKMCRVTS